MERIFVLACLFGLSGSDWSAIDLDRLAIITEQTKISVEIVFIVYFNVSTLLELTNVLVCKDRTYSPTTIEVYVPSHLCIHNDLSRPQNSEAN